MKNYNTKSDITQYARILFRVLEIVTTVIVSNTLVVCHCLHVDLSVVIELNIGKENKALSYTHAFSLQSPTFPAPHSDMCVTLEYTALMQFTVRLVCLSATYTVNVDVLRRSYSPLGYELHRVNFIVPDKGVEYEKCLLTFDILATKSGFLAAISNITLTEGTCVYPTGLFYLLSILRAFL